MKLYAKTASERGKEVGKGGNKEISTILTLQIDGENKEIGILKAAFDGKKYFVSAFLKKGKCDTKDQEILEIY